MDQGTVTVHSAKGARASQEDHYARFSTNRVHVYAVFDGHGGDECALASSHALRAFWTAAEAEYGDDIMAVTKEAIALLADATKNDQSGSTLSLVAIRKSDNHVWGAVLGDSPILIKAEGSGDSPRPPYSMPEHNVRTNTIERYEAEQRGGVYYRGYMMDGNAGLQMSRALGDVKLRFLSREPTIWEYSNVRYIILATDGVVDPGHKSETAKYELMDLVEAGAEAHDLVRRATDDLKTGDNATAFVIRLAKAPRLAIILRS